ncbi:MAG: hypothetical protein WCP96_06860 [Methylococcaceae bacterium]
MTCCENPIEYGHPITHGTQRELVGEQTPDISFAGGDIRGRDRRNACYYQMSCSLAQHYGFDLEVPFSELPKEAQDAVLW